MPSTAPRPSPVLNDHCPSACPACASDRIRSVGALRYSEHPTFAGNPVSLSHAPTLMACGDCGTWFTANTVAAAEAAHLYATGSGDTHWAASAFERGKPPEIVRALDALLHPPMRVVDVGCNTGELLDFCARRGATTIGVELSEVAGRICASKGHRVERDLGAITDPVDIVFAFDVVEHLYDLPGFLQAACSVLRPGGRLVILTGDNRSATARATRSRWWYAQYPEHVIFPSWRFWCDQGIFTNPVRLKTYAALSFRSSAKQRVQGALSILAGTGSGLPLIGPDHHLVMLTRP